MVVGSDSAGFLDDLLNDLYGRLEVLVILELGVLNEGTGGVLEDDAIYSGPEYSLEYFIIQDVDIFVADHVGRIEMLHRFEGTKDVVVHSGLFCIKSTCKIFAYIKINKCTMNNEVQNSL